LFGRAGDHIRREKEGIMAKLNVFSAVKMPPTYHASTSVSRTLNMQRTTFGIAAVPFMVEAQRDLTAPNVESDRHERSVSPGALAMLRAGKADVLAGRMTKISPALLIDDDDE